VTQLISDEYKELLQRTHQSIEWGAATHFRHELELKALMSRTGSKTILDWGSGREALRQTVERNQEGWKVYSYDPGRNLMELPEKVDVVVSCDVLEHVEPVYLIPTVETMFKIAQKGMYHVIACRHAKVVLADGSPAHLVVQPIEWWLDMLLHYCGRNNCVIDYLVGYAGKELRIRIVKRQDDV
jgi:hypothetical protein